MSQITTDVDIDTMNAKVYTVFCPLQVTEGFKSNPTGLSYKDEKMFKLEKLPITLITFLLCLYDFFRPEYHRYIDNWVTVYQIIAWVLILVVFLIMLKSTLQYSSFYWTLGNKRG